MRVLGMLAGGEGNTHLHNEKDVEEEGAHADETEAVNVPKEGEGECHQHCQHQQHHRTQDARGLWG